MAGKFLIKSRHGTVYYFRRRVPDAVRHIIGRRVIVQSLATSDRRVAVVMGRSLAAQTDSIFQPVVMATKSNEPDGFTFNYEMKLDFNELGRPSSLYVKADPEEQAAVNSAIRVAIEATGERGYKIGSQSSQKPFGEAIPEYFSKSQTKAQTKATYRSKLDHAQKFFGEAKDLYRHMPPAGHLFHRLPDYTIRVRAAIKNQIPDASFLVVDQVRF